MQVIKVAPPQVRYVDERKVSEITGVPVSTLQKQRHYRQGLPYSKFGKLVRYDLRDVEEFLESRKIRHEG